VNVDGFPVFGLTISDRAASNDSSRPGAANPHLRTSREKSNVISNLGFPREIKQQSRFTKLKLVILMKKLCLLFLFVLFSFEAAHAVVLHGVVAEVADGQTVVVLSNGRKLTVSLKGVEAPELKQHFGDVSRQYLASLILDKSVEVELREFKLGQVNGKVIWNQLDIGLQVIRDGAAWYDKVNGQNLTEAERTVYASAEQAARNEMRGLWQDGTPMPPWEWRRAEAEKFFPLVSKKRSPDRGLRTEDLLFNGRTVGGVARVGSKGTISSAKPTQKPLNSPGQDVDFSSYLRMGRTSIVYFYANWCPACREMTPQMDQINSGVPDMQVLFMDIAAWNTPVSRLHGVAFVPYLKVYDKSGNLVAEGRNARAWLQQNASRP